MKPTRLRILIIATAMATAALASSALAGALETVQDAQKNNARQGLNILRVASAVVDTETVTVNGYVFEVDTTVTAGITTGNIRLNLSGGSTAAAVGTLTLAENVANTETVTVGGKVYTFQTTLTNVANNVKIGTDASASLDNLIAAINAAAGSGTTYAALTAVNANVSAAAGAGDTMVVTARIPGAGGNAITSTETLAGSGNAWGAGVLASGVSPTAGEFTTALNTVINAGAYGARSTRISASEVLLTQSRPGAATLACTETLAGSNNVFAASTTFGGAGPSEGLGGVHLAKRTATATEAALETMHFAFPFSPSGVVVQITTSGVPKAWDGAVTITGARVDLASSGSTDIASGDVVNVLASE